MRKIKYFLPLTLAITTVFVLANAGILGGGDREELDEMDEFSKLLQVYDREEIRQHISGTIKAYDREKDDAMVEEVSFQFLKDGDLSYSRMHFLQNFSDGKISVQLDTVNKYVTISDAPAIREQSRAFPFETLFGDSAMFRTQLSVSERKDVRIMELKSESMPEIRLCRITYDTGSYRIRSAEIEWWKEGKHDETTPSQKCWLTVIVYHYLEPVKLDETRRMESVINLKDGKLEAIPSYGDYQVYSMIGN